MGNYLCLDIGNSRCKVGIFEGRELKSVETVAYADASGAALASRVEARLEAARPLAVGYTTVLGTDHPLQQCLQAYSQNAPVIRMDAFTHAPLHNAYKTPETLGADRFIAAVGAYSLQPQGALLVIDAGTALTYEYVDATHSYRGGAIAPGLHMRYQALHQYTARLPLLAVTPDETHLVGSSTAAALRSGVQNGTLAEVAGICALYEALAGGQHNLTVFVTGGDTSFFEKHLKRTNFAVPHLVLLGIRFLLGYNGHDR